jgi:hypothetical protein
MTCARLTEVDYHRGFPELNYANRFPSLCKQLKGRDTYGFEGFSGFADAFAYMCCAQSFVR